MKMQKKILVIFLFLMIALTVNCFALSEGDNITFELSDGTVIETTMPAVYEMNEENMKEDPLYEKYMNTRSVLTLNSENVSESIAVEDIISTYETSDTVVGIDVSYYQETIDWSKVADSGVKFVMIRCGYRGYGSEGNLVTDTKFKEYIQGALNNGLDVGIYFFSAAINEAEAIQEAAYVVDLIKNYDITYPVAYDFEYYGNKYDSTSGNPYRTNGLSNNQLNKNAKAFLEYIESAGYTACLYGSSSYLNGTWDLDLSYYYDIWVAHYDVDNPSYTRVYNMWQITSSGSVPGISGSVDIDISYTRITDYLFDATYYADRYSDLKAAFGYNKAKLKEHWLTNGIKEGRTASPVYDAKYYLNKYDDLKSAFGSNYESAYAHFITSGIYEGEGRQGSKYFNISYYNRSSSLSNVNALIYFVEKGLSLGQLGSEDFNIITYYDSQTDYTKSELGTKYLRYYALADGGSPINDYPFLDIKTYTWYSEATKYLYINEIIEGYEDGTFKPNTKMTRGQFVTILWRMEGEPESTTTVSSLSDLSKSSYYYEAVLWAEENDIVKGYKDGTFKASTEINRQQLAVFLKRYSEYKGIDTSNVTSLDNFADSSSVTSYAVEAIQWAVANGVIEGYTDENTKYIRPANSASRAEAACMIYNFCTKILE